MLSTINKMCPYAVFVYQSEAVSDTLHSVWQFWSQPFVQYNNLILTVKTDTNSACIALLSCGFNRRSHSCCVPKIVLSWFPAGLRNLSIAAANGKNGFCSNLGLDFYTTGLGVQFRFVAYVRWSFLLSAYIYFLKVTHSGICNYTCLLCWHLKQPTCACDMFGCQPRKGNKPAADNKRKQHLQGTPVASSCRPGAASLAWGLPIDSCL